MAKKVVLSINSTITLITPSSHVSALKQSENTIGIDSDFKPDPPPFPLSGETADVTTDRRERAFGLETKWHRFPDR